MDFLDRAAKHLIAKENGLIKEQQAQKHTHTPTQEKDEILLLRGRLFNHLILDPDPPQDPETKFTRREFLDTIKIVEKLTDDRPAKDRLNLLISHGCCVQIEGSKRTTKLIKFKDREQKTIASAKFQSELKK